MEKKKALLLSTNVYSEPRFSFGSLRPKSFETKESGDKGKKGSRVETGETL